MGQKLTGFKGSKLIIKSVGCSSRKILGAKVKNNVIVGLEDCADTRIGNWHCRGISNGEKKRLSIGLEILTQPYVLLLDEPTTGLDSEFSFHGSYACYVFT